MTFSSILSIVSAGIGALSTALIFYTRVALDRSRDAAMKTAGRFERVLASDDLAELGDYLYRDLGKVSVSAYASDDATAKNLDHLVAHLREYVSADPLAAAVAPSTPGDPDGDAASSERPPVPDSAPAPETTFVPADRFLRDVRDQILNGQVWNALAALRREVEQRLIAIAAANDITAGRLSAQRLLGVLAREGILPRPIEQKLAPVLRLANEAIHGEDVDPLVALDVLSAADPALKMLVLHAPIVQIAVSSAYTSPAGVVLQIAVRNSSEEGLSDLLLQALSDDAVLAEVPVSPVPPNDVKEAEIIVPSLGRRNDVTEADMVIRVLRGGIQLARLDARMHDELYSILRSSEAG